jgi:hypothetical protein
MKRKKQILESSNKKNKFEIHPLSLVFNYINDFSTFYKASLVCKKWQIILDNHIFWKTLCEHLDLEEPKPKAKKYKTWKSIFIKNINKLCICKRNIKIKNSNLKNINFKLRILSYYSLNRLNFYKTEIYCQLCQYTRDELEILYQQSNNFNEYCKLCNNEEDIIDSVKELINKLYRKKKEFGNIQFSDYIEKDFFKVIIRNLYKIIDYDDYLFIKQLGGVVKNWNFEIKYIKYEDL